MSLSSLFNFLIHGSFRCVALMTVCWFLAALSNAQVDSFDLLTTTPQDAPVVDPFSSVPTNPESAPTEPAVSPFSDAAQPETSQPETSQPATVTPSPFEAVDSETVPQETPMQPATTQPPAAKPPSAKPQAVVDPFSTVAPAAESEESASTTKETMSKKAMPISEEPVGDEDAIDREEPMVSEKAVEGEANKPIADDADGSVKNAASAQRPDPSPTSSSWLSKVYDFLPYIGVLVGILLLGLLGKMLLGKKKNKFDKPSTKVRENDPDKSSFKKSDRFSSTAIDKAVNTDVGSDVISEVEEVSGLRLNESDILAESPNVPDQSDLNFDAFDVTTEDGDFNISDDGIDDDDFAAMMLDDDGDEEFAAKTGSDVLIEEIDEFTLDDDDSLENASEAVADHAANVDEEISIENADPKLEVGPEASIDDSDEFDFGLDDDEDVPATGSEAITAEAITDKGTAFELVDAAEDAATDVGEAMDIDLEPAEPDNLAVEFGLGAAAAAGVAAIGSALAGGDKAATVEEIEAAASDFVQEKAELNRRIAELESKLSAAQSESATLESLQAQLDESEEQKSDFQSKLNAAEEKAKQLKTQLDQATVDNDSATEDSEGKLAEAEQKVTQLESELSKSVETIELTEKSLAELKTENELLKEEAADAQANEALKEEVEAAKQESAKLQSTLNESELSQKESLSEIDQLKGEIEKLKSENEKLAQEVQLASSSAESAEAEDEGVPTESLMSAALGGVGGAALGAAANGDAGSSEELEREKKLRVDTEAMLVEAEEQRTVVAEELRKVRKEVRKLKEAGNETASDDSDAVEKLTRELEDAKAEIAKLSEARDESLSAVAGIESAEAKKKTKLRS